ncbi:MAG: acetoin utilization protein AcuC [Chloroflexi bacterium]|nr:acetoin utilization protein AcuC [Chloroflexota bacterium]
MRRAAYIYDESLSRHVLREDHVMRPSRLRYTYELLEACGAFSLPNSRLVSPRLANDEDVLTFHSPDYVAAVRSFSNGKRLVDPARYNFSDWGDNPIFPGMYEASLLSVGASLVAAELVAQGEVDVAFNTGGGLHHAAPAAASGFCVFNDPAIAIKHLMSRGLKVAYLDIDAHHGDGVQLAFYDTDAVLTISLHESGHYLFPGTGGVSEIGQSKGRGYSVNIPLAPNTDDETYLWAFREVVPPLIGRFRPDVLVSQLGVDTHFSDPITHMKLTTGGYIQVVEDISRLCPHWVALGGGGYDVSAVARCWTLAYGVMAEHDWPDEIPQSYQEQYGLKSLRDGNGPELSAATKAQARKFAEETVAAVRRQVFPIHGL